MARTSSTTGLVHLTTADADPLIPHGHGTSVPARVADGPSRSDIQATTSSAVRPPPESWNARRGTTREEPAMTVTPDQWPSTQLLTVTARPTPSGAVVVTVRGEVDSRTGPLLQDVALANLTPAGPPLVIDLTGVTFLGAAGLTVLDILGRSATAANVRLSLVAHARVVLRPLTLTGLDREFDIHSALADALPLPGGGPDG